MIEGLTPPEGLTTIRCKFRSFFIYLIWILLLNLCERAYQFNELGKWFNAIDSRQARNCERKLGRIVISLMSPYRIFRKKILQKYRRIRALLGLAKKSFIGQKLWLNYNRCEPLIDEGKALQSWRIIVYQCNKVL